MKKLEKISKSPNINIPESPHFSTIPSYSYCEDTELFSSSPPQIERKSLLSQQISTNKLYLAVRNNNHEEAEIALQEGALINFPNRIGKTLLFNLVENLKIDCFKVFLRYKVDLDARDNDGRTAIFYAVKNHDLDMVIELIKAGAMVDIMDFDEITLLDFVRKIGDEKIVDIIKPYYCENIKKLVTDEVEDASILNPDEHNGPTNDDLIFSFEKGREEFTGDVFNYKTCPTNIRAYPTGVIGEYGENDS